MTYIYDYPTFSSNQGKHRDWLSPKKLQSLNASKPQWSPNNLC